MTSANPKSVQHAESAPERLMSRAARSDFYFSPDPSLAEMHERVESLLTDLVKSEIQVMDVIGRHMLFGYAKRLRPIFVLLAQKLYKDEILDSTVDCGAICELIHCASLFHDDVIDGAKTRKGRRAANTIWGNKSAVIMGDEFFVLAFTRLAQLKDVRLVEIFVNTCKALAEGVMLEIKHQGDLNVTEDNHLKIMTSKTAMFFGEAARVGGYLGGADDDGQWTLAEFGVNFGLAFQMSDDLLDLYSDPEATGKPRGTDITAGIYTIPVIYALQNDAAFASEFREIIEDDKLDPDVIAKIAADVKSAGGFDYAKDMIMEYAEKASVYLERLPYGASNDMFKMLVEKIVGREYV